MKFAKKIVLTAVIVAGVLAIQCSTFAAKDTRTVAPAHRFDGTEPMPPYRLHIDGTEPMPPYRLHIDGTEPMPPYRLQIDGTEPMPPYRLHIDGTEPMPPYRF